MPGRIDPLFLAFPNAAAPSRAVASAALPSFHELLSDLNPLQYIPVVGTLYRAMTGDRIPEAARLAGGFVVSGLIGGPLGMVTNLALLAVERLTGIDPEAIGLRVLAGLGVGVEVAAPAPPVPAVLPAARLRAYNAAAAHGA